MDFFISAPNAMTIRVTADHADMFRRLLAPYMLVHPLDISDETVAELTQPAFKKLVEDLEWVGTW